MEISFDDVCDKLKAIKDPAAFAKKMGIGKLTDIDPIAMFPPNGGQETMRKFLAELGFTIPPDEEVSITLYPDVV
jgi:hypothetical protein